MTRKEGISRRALLGSLGAVGIAGGTLSAKTTGLLTDTETLAGSIMSGGQLDLLVSWPGGTSEDGTATLAIDMTDGGSGSETITVELPDSNPGRVWLRTRCPSGLADSVTGTLSYVCDGSVVASGSLLELANVLRNGVHLDPPCATDEGCLDGDDRLELLFEWEFTPTDDYDGTDPDDVELHVEFHATQCRYMTPTNPFPEIDPCEGGTDSRHAISFIAFCSAESGSIGPTITGTNPNSSEPTSADWETAVPVGYVIVKWSTYMTIYDYTDNPKKSGTAIANDPDAAIRSYETKPRSGPGPADAARPGDVAKEALDDTDFDVERTAKLEYEGEWIEE